MAESVFFWIIAPISLGAAISMVLMRNPVHAALMLVVNFFTIALLYAVMEAQFLAVVQVIVYAGAIMVLFLFVLMLLGVNRDAPLGGRLRGQGPAAVALGFVLLVALTVAVVVPVWGAVCPTGPDVAEATAGPAGFVCTGLAAANAPGNVEAVGALLFTTYVWPFEVTSLLLVIAAIGAIVLGRKKEKPEDLVDQPIEVAPAGAHVQATGERPAGEVAARRDEPEEPA